ncbi:MAG TPA: cytochrome P450, partial [Tepidiformaceae bacterium]|nr:cytochrome P450 [Tepidiformaceae bacterium]
MTQQATLNPDEQINLSDDTLFERGVHHEAFRWLRKHDPISWNPGNENVKGYWSLVRYEDVLHVSRHPEIFSSERGIVMFEPVRDEDRAAAAAGNGKMLITMDPPRHVKLRRLVNKGFTPRAVNAMEPHIREITNQLLDDIANKGRCDFVIDVSSQLPLAVICGMMGLEKKDWPLLFKLTNKVLGSGDPEYQEDVPEDQRGTPEAGRTTNNMGTMQMFGFFAQLLTERKANRKDDLISLLVESEVDGEALTDEDILWFCFLLILAGNETTRNAISGGLIALCEHPDQKAKLLANPGLMPSAVEEVLRWVSPVTHMARVALEDTKINGQEIAKGERVVMWYPAVNRDEAIFPDGDVFDIERSPNDHLAFGIGEHFCLGAGFARLELKVMFEELFRRFPDIEMDGPAERLRSTFIGGIK